MAILGGGVQAQDDRRERSSARSVAHRGYITSFSVSDRCLFLVPVSSRVANLRVESRGNRGESSCCLFGRVAGLLRTSGLCARFQPGAVGVYLFSVIMPKTSRAIPVLVARFCRRSPVGAPGRGVGRPILRCATAATYPDARTNWRVPTKFRIWPSQESLF
jgi:hypothetical protein